jgi:hypothetical protein
VGKREEEKEEEKNKEKELMTSFFLSPLAVALHRHLL